MEHILSVCGSLVSNAISWRTPASNNLIVESLEAKAARLEAEMDDFVNDDVVVPVGSALYVPVIAQSILSCDATKAEQLYGYALELSAEVKKLTAEEKVELKPQFIQVYTALRQLQETFKADSASANKQTQQAITKAITALRQSEVYLSDHLATLCGFASLADKIVMGESSSPEGQLLVVDKGILAFSDKSDGNGQQLALKRLKNVETALKNEDACAQLTDNQLLQMKLTISWTMLAYLSQQKTGLDLVEHSFETLFLMNQQLNAILAKRKDLDVDADLVTSLALVVDQIQTLYSDDFWVDAKHGNQLRNIEPFVASLLSFIGNSNQVDLAGLTFLHRDDANGIALFEAPEVEGEKNYVALFFGRDGVVSYYDPRQSRNPNFDLGGLGHDPIYQSAGPASAAFELLMKEKADKSKPFKLTTAGFGVDGAVGQMVAFSQAIANPDSKIVSCCVGTAPYLELNASEAMLRQKNLYGINFQLVGDTLTKPSAFSTYAAKKYSETNWELNLPLYNRDWFMSDSLTRGHDASIYREKVQRAVKQPQQLLQVRDELRTIIG